MARDNCDNFAAKDFARAGATAFARAGQNIDVAPNVVLGLRAILQLVQHEDASDLSQEFVSELISTAARALPVLAQWAHGVVPIERVGLGIIAAANLITLFGQPGTSEEAMASQPMVLDQIDHVALLAAEIEVAIRQKRIAERGDPFRRSGLARQLASATKTNCVSLH